MNMKYEYEIYLKLGILKAGNITLENALGKKNHS